MISFVALGGACGCAAQWHAQHRRGRFAPTSAAIARATEISWSLPGSALPLTHCEPPSYRAQCARPGDGPLLTWRDVMYRWAHAIEDGEWMSRAGCRACAVRATRERSVKFRDFLAYFDNGRPPDGAFRRMIVDEKRAEFAGMKAWDTVGTRRRQAHQATRRARVERGSTRRRGLTSEIGGRCGGITPTALAEQLVPGDDGRPGQ